MDKKTSQIGPIRMSEKEDHLIRQAAEKKELKPATFIRQCAVKESKKVMGQK